jgi:hypothetical protein
MLPVNKRQMCIHWQAQIHASTSLIINNSETSSSKIRENLFSSWKQARIILFMNMKTGWIFKNRKNFKNLKELVKVFQSSVRVETNDYHQKMWREWPNIGLKIEPMSAGSCFCLFIYCQKFASLAQKTNIA